MCVCIQYFTEDTVGVSQAQHPPSHLVQLLHVLPVFLPQLVHRSLLPQ